MKVRRFNRYSYSELLTAAARPGAQQIDIDTLGEWFSCYGWNYWNGEYFDADGHRVRPVYDWDEEADQGSVVAYEIF